MEVAFSAGSTVVLKTYKHYQVIIVAGDAPDAPRPAPASDIQSLVAFVPQHPAVSALLQYHEEAGAVETDGEGGDQDETEGIDTEHDGKLCVTGRKHSLYSYRQGCQNSADV